jgi:hypothetical protein
MKTSVKVYVPFILSRNKWVPMEPYKFSCEENAWKTLETAFGADPFRQAVISIDEDLFYEKHKEWTLGN